MHTRAARLALVDKKDPGMVILEIQREAPTKAEWDVLR